jgi:hypothetical protein
VDAAGRLHVERIKAIPEPESLIDLRKRVNAMLPRADLPEVLLEVMGWVRAFARAFAQVRRVLAAYGHGRAGVHQPGAGQAGDAMEAVPAREFPAQVIKS